MITLAAGSKTFDQSFNGRYYDLTTLPQPDPQITAMSGNFVYGDEITIDGVFSNVTSSQVAYLTGNPVSNGQGDSRIVPINGSAYNPADIHNYKHATDQSIVGSGASLKFENVAPAGFGAANPSVILPTGHKQVYATYFLRLNLPNIGSQGGGQIKLGRLNGVAGSHSYEPTQGSTPLYNAGGTRLELYTQDELNMIYRQTGDNSILTTEHMQEKWVRIEHWCKLPPRYAKQEYKNKVWTGANIPSTGENYRCNPFLSSDIVLTDRTGTVDRELGNMPKSWHKFMLPFYIRDWMTATVHCDGVLVNVSPERVEFHNNANLNISTKKFIQPVIANGRLPTQIKVNCQTGAFAPSDNIYCTVINDDGSRSNAFLFRPAV